MQRHAARHMQHGLAIIPAVNNAPTPPSVPRDGCTRAVEWGARRRRRRRRPPTSLNRVEMCPLQTAVQPGRARARSGAGGRAAGGMSAVTTSAREEDGGGWWVWTRCFCLFRVIVCWIICLIEVFVCEDVG